MTTPPGPQSRRRQMSVQQLTTVGRRGLALVDEWAYYRSACTTQVRHLGGNMSRLLRRRVLTGAGVTAGLAGLAVSGSLAFAATGDGPVITACIDSKGNVRVVDSASLCRADERSISWNKEGPVGPDGAPGADGTDGAAGEAGTAGAAGSNGSAGAPGQAGQDGQDGAQGVTGPQGPAGAPGQVAGGSGDFGQPASITCTQQGSVIQGSEPDGSSVVEAASYGVASPRDVATGQSSGRRQHKPVTISKQIDRASPLYFKALVLGQVLSSCTITFVTTQPDGSEVDAFRMVLSNANVVDHQFVKGDTRLTGAGPLGEYESLSFTFQEISLTHVPSGVTAQDSFSTTS